MRDTKHESGWKIKKESTASTLLEVLVTHRPQKAFSLLHFFSLTNYGSLMKDDLVTSDGITMEDKAALR